MRSFSAKRLSLIAFLCVSALTVTGCHYGAPPDPNDPRDVGIMTAETVRRNLRWANLMLLEREAAHEITAHESRDRIAERAQELIADLDINKVDRKDAWEYAEIFMTAEDWKTAKIFLEKALQKPANEDRRINDSIRLAEVETRLGNVPHALELAGSVLNAPDNEGAPVLPGIYLQLAPIAKGKGHDIELAELILEAVKVHQRVKVDPKSEAGMAFLAARRHHIRTAIETAQGLFEGAGRADLSKQAQSTLLEIEQTI